MPCAGNVRDSIIDYVTQNPIKGLNMPRYPATMADLPYPVGEEAALKGGQTLKATVDGIHEKQWCHNDIKPSNVFLDSNGEINVFVLRNTGISLSRCFYS